MQYKVFSFVAIAAVMTFSGQEVLALPPPPSPVEAIARAYRKTPSAATRAALANFAAQHAKDIEGGNRSR
jgi:hypothetical protein